MLHLSSSSFSPSSAASSPSSTSPDRSFHCPPLARSSKENDNQKEQTHKLEIKEKEECDSVAELLGKTGDEGSPEKQAKARAAWQSKTWLKTSPQAILAKHACWATTWKTGGKNSSSSSSFLSPPHSPSPAVPHLDEDALEVLYVELIRLRLEEGIRLRAAVEVSLRAEQHQRLLLSAKQMLENAQIHNLGSSDLHTPPKRGMPPHSGSAYTSQNTTELGLDKRGHLPWQQTQDMLHSPLQHQNCSTEASLQALYQHQNINTTKAKGNTLYPRHTHSSTTSEHGMKNRSGMFDAFLNTQGRESGGGTGVFIPRRTNELDANRKPACSTVLLPTHIVQPLNFNIEGAIYSHVSDLDVSTPRNREMMYESTNINGNAWIFAQSQLQEVTPGVTLPKEWTY